MMEFIQTLGKGITQGFMVIAGSYLWNLIKKYIIK